MLRIIDLEANGGDGDGGAGGDGGDGGEQKPDDKGGGDGGQAQTFTQEHVDRIVKERLARERAKYEGYDDLKKKAEEYDKLQDEQKSELERERAAREKAEAEAEKARQLARETTIRSAIIAEAARADREKRVADPEGALAHLTGIDSDLLELDADGNPKDIAKAMDSLLEKRPYLVASQGGGRQGTGGSADQGARGRAEPTDFEKLDDPRKVRETVGKLR